jgi:hypothetical protein
MAVFKTALNLAHEDGFVTGRQAWASKLKPVPAATGRRDCYLDLAQRKALIEHQKFDTKFKFFPEFPNSGLIESTV